MSTRIFGREDDTPPLVSVFWGGVERGVSYQITDVRLGYAQLTTREAEGVAKAILADIKKRRKEMRGGKSKV